MKQKIEARYFFKNLNENLLFLNIQPQQCEYTMNEDEYFFVDINQVVKIRNESTFEIKKIIKHELNYKIFKEKMIMPIKSIHGWNMENNKKIHKKRYKYKLENEIKLEIAKLEADGDVYFSFCIESKNKNSVEECIKEYKHELQNALKMDGKLVLSYTEFLQWLEKKKHGK